MLSHSTTTKRYTDNAYERRKVLFIGGYGRSGSTLLDRILGCIPGFESVGELRYLWDWGLRRNLLCACGMPTLDCPFWSFVLQSVFGQLDKVDVDRLLEMKASVERSPSLISLFVPNRLLGGDGPTMAEYSRVIADLYDSIARQSGCRFIVDSSKHPSRAALLSRLPNIDLYVIHLVRDSRAVAYSWQRKRIRPEVLGNSELMDVHGTTRCVAHWLGHNRLIASLYGHTNRYRLLRYEDLVASPKDTLRQLLDWLGEPNSDLSFLDGENVVIKQSHTVAGNPMRFRTGPIQVKDDNEWQHEFGFWRKLVVSLCTGPMLLRHRYRLWA